MGSLQCLPTFREAREVPRVRRLAFCQFSANRTVLINCHYQSSVTSDQVPSSAYVPASLTSRELRFQLQGNKVAATDWWRAGRRQI